MMPNQNAKEEEREINKKGHQHRMEELIDGPSGGRRRASLPSASIQHSQQLNPRSFRSI